MSESRDDKGFSVVDKRASAGAADEPRAEAPAPEARSPIAGEAPGAAPAPPDARPESAGARVDFATLVQSFFVTALYHLGLAADPETREPAPPNLPAARQNIEILELLEEKTRGNLDPDERQLLESVLYELRMRFVEASRAPRA